MKAIVGGTIFEKKSVFVAQSEDGRDRPVALQRQTNIEVILETIDQRLEPSLGLRRSPVPPACDNEEIIKTIQQIRGAAYLILQSFAFSTADLSLRRAAMKTSEQRVEIGIEI